MQRVDSQLTSNTTRTRLLQIPQGEFWDNSWLISPFYSLLTLPLDPISLTLRPQFPLKSRSWTMRLRILTNPRASTKALTAVSKSKVAYSYSWVVFLFWHFQVSPLRCSAPWHSGDTSDHLLHWFLQHNQYYLWSVLCAQEQDRPAATKEEQQERSCQVSRQVHFRQRKQLHC